MACLNLLWREVRTGLMQYAASICSLAEMPHEL